jgi:N-acetyl-1-D-myo-inositol-2-amino-2-deoxy-alpha-D-glucopyranoside deacetylase
MPDLLLSEWDCDDPPGLRNPDRAGDVMTAASHRPLCALRQAAGKLVRMETPRLLFVHAHPDDETLTTGATIAHYAALGAKVRVVTCTLGEEGEVIGERWAQLAVDQADQLGGFRIGELSRALNALGIDEPIFLGGPGRWRDSGMEGTPQRHRQRFIDADPREAVGALVSIIRELRPHVVVTYDADGGYGHPDHIHAHQVTMAAVAASDGAEYSGEAWTVPKVYWAVIAKSAMAAGFDAFGDVAPEWIRVSIDDVPFGYPDDAIDAVMEVADQLPAKIAALRAHATQVTVAANGRSCALSNNIALPIGAIEHYILAVGTPGERDDRGWETDLLAGLNLE